MSVQGHKFWYVWVRPNGKYRLVNSGWHWVKCHSGAPCFNSILNCCKFISLPFGGNAIDRVSVGIKQIIKLHFAQMDKQELEQLATRIANGEATPNEVAEYNAWFNMHSVNHIWPGEELGDAEAIKRQLFTDIYAEIKQREPARIRPIYYRLAAAASILMIIARHPDQYSA